MENPFRKKSIAELKRENEFLQKQTIEQKEYARLYEENRRLKEEKKHFDRLGSGFQFDTDGLMDGVDMLIGKKPSKPAKRTRR